MAITIKEVSERSELKKFVKFAHNHYRGNAYYVPTLVLEEIDTLSPKKNPAFKFCDCVFFMAYKNDVPVGRIAGIINHRSNEIWGQKKARFGWIEFTDEPEVSEALLHAVEQWAKSKDMDEVHGPMGFTDFDYEGMLIEGFDQLGTMASIYNYAYYPKHMKRLGYEKDADWVEFRIKIEENAPERYQRIAQIVQKKYDLNFKKFKNGKEIIKNGYGKKIFELLNQAYSSLYGYVPLTDKQIDYYVGMYIPMLRVDFITLITDKDDNAIAVGITIPSLSNALRKCWGKLLPFGFIHLLRALKGKDKHDTVDLYLIAVRPDYQGKGVNALLFNDLTARFYANGYYFAETNPELEINQKVQSQWESYENVQHKRRRAFVKTL